MENVDAWDTFMSEEEKIIYSSLFSVESCLSTTAYASVLNFLREH